MAEGPAGAGAGGEERVAGLALLLLDYLCAALAEVGEGDEADGVGGEALVGRLVLGDEAGGGFVGHVCGGG